MVTDFELAQQRRQRNAKQAARRRFGFLLCCEVTRFAGKVDLCAVCTLNYKLTLSVVRTTTSFSMTAQSSGLTLSPPGMSLPSFNPCSPRRMGGSLAGGSSQSAALLSPSLGAARQAEMVERLRQLMAWQERQKASLLRQQQEEIIRIHRQSQEQNGDGMESKTVACSDELNVVGIEGEIIL